MALGRGAVPGAIPVSRPGLTRGAAGRGPGSGPRIASTGYWDGSGSSVTELNAADGSWVRTLSGGAWAETVLHIRPNFTGATAIAADRAHIWITNTDMGGFSGSVTELNASDGSWVQTLSGSGYSFKNPGAVIANGTHVWVINGSGSVTMLTTR